MSDTPRMDAAWEAHQEDPTSDAGDPWGMASRLERELSAMTAAKNKAVGALKGCVEQMGHTLPYSFAPDGMDKLIAELEEVK